MDESKSFVDGGDPDLVACPYLFGRGRGFLNQTSEPRMPGHRERMLDTPQLASTRILNRPVPSQVEDNTDLGSLITQLAEKLGDSIKAKLHSGESACSGGASNLSYPSNVNVVMHSDAKEPPIF